MQRGRRGNEGDVSNDREVTDDPGTGTEDNVGNGEDVQSAAAGIGNADNMDNGEDVQSSIP